MKLTPAQTRLKTENKSAHKHAKTDPTPVRNDEKDPQKEAKPGQAQPDQSCLQPDDIPPALPRSDDTVQAALVQQPVALDVKSTDEISTDNAASTEPLAGEVRLMMQADASSHSRMFATKTGGNLSAVARPAFQMAAQSTADADEQAPATLTTPLLATPLADGADDSVLSVSASSIDTHHNAAQHTQLPDGVQDSVTGQGVAAVDARTTETPSVAAMTTGTLTQEVGTPAWQQSLSQQLACFTRDGVHHAQLRLHPEELGEIQINLRLNNDQAQLHFVTDNHQVRAALESAMPHLRTSLAESGIQLGQSSVGAETSSSSSWHSAPTDDSARQAHAGDDEGTPVTQASEENQTLTRVVNYRSGISTFV